MALLQEAGKTPVWVLQHDHSSRARRAGAEPFFHRVQLPLVGNSHFGSHVTFLQVETRGSYTSNSENTRDHEEEECKLTAARHSVYDDLVSIIGFAQQDD